MGWSYVTPMTPCDVRWCHQHDGGVGCVTEGGLSWKVDQFGNLSNPSHFN